MEIIIAILAFCFGAILLWLILRPQLKTVQKLDTETIEQNQEIKEEYKALNKKLSQLKTDVDSLSAQKTEIASSIISLETQADEAGKKLFDSAKKVAEANFEISATQMANNYNQAKQDCEKVYLDLLKDLQCNFLNKTQEYQAQISDWELKLQEKKIELEKQRLITAAAIEANKRSMAETDEKNFYRIQLSDLDLKEIEALSSISHLLRDPEPLYKIIWKTYYEKPTSALLGRIIGEKIKTGIYKITNLENGMCYIGQSVNIADRFKAHIKAGLGIDSSNNKFYSALKQFKVENFTFEILEECDRTQLNEQERYWIKFFQSETFGYNSTRGNA